MPELSILVPVLRRPHRVKPVMESIRKATPDAQVFFLCDPDDEEEIEAVLSHPEADFLAPGGRYSAKINLGVTLTEAPLLFFGADDLEFHEGWFEAAKEKLTKGIGVVATNDLCNARVMRGELATHPLVTREYTKLGTIDDPTKVLHEGYEHEYVDREFSETAQHRNAFAYAEDAIVEHLHPLVGKAPNDELYDRIWDRMWSGRRVYARRMNKWGMSRVRNDARNTKDKEWVARRSKSA
jgi:glycosyltransferase involved in cell wall biosynthesis